MALTARAGVLAGLLAIGTPAGEPQCMPSRDCALEHAHARTLRLLEADSLTLPTRAFEMQQAVVLAALPRRAAGARERRLLDEQTAFKIAQTLPECGQLGAFVAIYEHGTP